MSKADIKAELEAFINSGKATSEVNSGNFVTTHIDPLKVAEHFYKQAMADLKADVIERTVKVDAGGYPYIDCNIELYDYDKDIPLAQKGDKVKVVILKDE